MASFESDSGEQASTIDDVESSHHWTTDFEEDDSETEEEINKNIKTNSNEEDDDSDCDSDHPNCYNSSLLQNQKKCNKNIDKRFNSNNHFEKPQVQSDTETRNLLDDIGDFDEDYLDLQDASFNTDHQQQQFSFNTLSAAAFDLTNEQYDYYTKCFLYLLEKTQGHAQINGALNGVDSRVIQFFKKSFLDNLVLSNIWALADVNEDGFLNLSEFIIAMHLIVLHLKADVSIPSCLPSSVRPPLTPTRQLVQLSNDCYATVFASNQPEELCSTTTSSASNSSSLKTNITNANDDTLQNLNNSQSNQHTSFTFQPYSICQNNFIYSNNNSNYLLSELSTKNINDSKTITIDDAFVNKEEWTPSGVKQHSLSDDHLHLYAHRESTIANFSDVPPVLVDNYPTALNGRSITSARGPPPKPPIRNYFLNSKGHGRSASLDLKTFSEILSPHLNLSTQENSQTFMNQQKLETLSEDWNQINFLQQKSINLKKNNLNFKEKATQTEIDLNFENFTLFNDKEFFFTDETYNQMSCKERCKYLKLLNAELENERVKLAEVRLQLQIEIEETEKKIQTVLQNSLKNVNNLTITNSVALKPTTL